jgi:hypothetical protein
MIKSFLTRCKEIRDSKGIPDNTKYWLILNEIQHLQEWSDQISEDVDAIAINDHYDKIDQLLDSLHSNHFDQSSDICKIPSFEEIFGTNHQDK